MMKSIPVQTQLLILLAGVIAAPSMVLAQSSVEVNLRLGEVRCADEIVKLKQVATFKTNDAYLSRLLEAMEVAWFEENQDRVVITKEQVRIRLMLAGLKADQFQLSGPERMNVVAVSHAAVRETVELEIQEQLASQYFMSPANLKVTIDRRFGELENSRLDFSSLRLEEDTRTELPLGRQIVSATIEDSSGRSLSIKVPISVAVIRDLVVAKKNISKGQSLSGENVESVRRPVSSQNVRFASFEQVVGKQAQSDIQQYALIKSNFVRDAPFNSQFAIKKNSLVNVVVRRGRLAITLKNAKALENGNPGDQISVLNQDTEEPIHGTVVDSTRVEIRY